VVVCLPGLALAGEVYKSVGPDGKVTYSDKPPTTNSDAISKDLRARDPALRIDVVKAALEVYAKEVIVETAYRFCAKQVPQSASRVGTARDDWMQRNAVLRAKKIIVLHDKFSTGELIELSHKMQRDNDGVLRTLEHATPEERSKWCTDAPKTFAAPEFDLAGKQNLVEALVTYQVKGERGHPEG
jgi:hypothetical protein